MADVFEAFAEHSYLGIFLLVLGINAAPILMPPSWIVLTSFYLLDPGLDVAALALVGATASTAGRFILKRASGLFRRFVSPEQQSNLDTIDGCLSGRRYGHVLASFVFGATPLPSNFLFITFGLMRTRGAGIYAGFWAGRAISYAVMIHFGNVVLSPLLEIFEDRLVGILVVDAAGVAVVLLLASVNWVALLTQRRLRFVRPRLWRA